MDQKWKILRKAVKSLTVLKTKDESQKSFNFWPLSVISWGITLSSPSHKYRTTAMSHQKLKCECNQVGNPINPFLKQSITTKDKVLFWLWQKRSSMVPPCTKLGSTSTSNSHGPHCGATMAQCYLICHRQIEMLCGHKDLKKKINCTLWKLWKCIKFGFPARESQCFDFSPVTVWQFTSIKGAPLMESWTQSLICMWMLSKCRHCTSPLLGQPH